MKKSTFIGFLIVLVVLIGLGIYFFTRLKVEKPAEKAEIAPVAPKQEIIAEFKASDELQMSPYKANNVEGRVHVSNDVLELYYANNLKKRDIFAFYVPVNKPNVKTLILKVRIWPGTYFTMDVIANGTIVSPRTINYYKGTGEWEELSIPIGGTLNAISISIGEPSDKETQNDYKVEIDWITVVQF